MLKRLRTFFSPDSPDREGIPPPGSLPSLPAQIRATNVDPFDFAAALEVVNGLPAPDWQAVSHWIESIPDMADKATAWSACEEAWLQHLGRALGLQYHVRADGDALLLSSLDEGSARKTLAFMNRTQDRIKRVLEGIAEVPEWGKDILIVLDDQDTYYKYVDRYYAGEGEFAGSSGMYINAGCGHFVTAKAELISTEPVIAHEMTHACLAHLPIPAWLNEGIAVNTEHRLCPPSSPLHTPRQMHDKHLAFWGDAEIQEFWSGKSFLRADDGNMLSYDLARILVAQFSLNWAAFQSFVLNANLEDAGAAAAREHLGMDLGAAVTAVLEREGADWSPDPGRWESPPEKGAFRP